MPPHLSPTIPFSSSSSTTTHPLPCTHRIHTRLPHCTPSCWPLSTSPSCRTCLRYRAESRLYTALRSGASGANRANHKCHKNNASTPSRNTGNIDPLAVESQIRCLRDEIAGGEWPRRVRRAEYEVWRKLGDVGWGVWVGEVEGGGRKRKYGEDRLGDIDEEREVEMVESGKGDGGRSLGEFVRLSMKEAGGRQEEVAKEKKKSVERANAERERAVMAKREMVAEEEKERAEWERLRKKMIQREKLQRLEAATKTLGEMIREGLGGWDASEVGD